jgi:glycosidase
MTQAHPAGRDPVHPGELHALGLIDEILHYVCGLYREQIATDTAARALEFVERRIGASALSEVLEQFTDCFPPLAVHRGESSPSAYLAGRSGALSHREITLEELMMLWLANVNPAFAPFRELFDDSPLGDTGGYAELVEALQTFFATQPTFGPDHQPLVNMLRSPAIASPHSLAGQLEYIRERWGHLLGDLLRKLLLALDVMQEEERARRLRAVGAGALKGRAPVLEFGGELAEPERFSPDRDWMPRVVLIAKSTHVWMDQLSRAYGRAITRLDHIPDEELDRLARWGITGLWLIGLWQRSQASQRIKQLTGNPDAAASAYSLDDYEISDDLGGNEACANLRDRAWRRGIRLASDMVPNHMGIDSRWVVEHPHWFLSLPHPPYPSYSFNGPDLSHDSRVVIQLEDHYYDRSDAAVVFKRMDRASGETRFIYHGNDGTQMPWNDTAQLDYLNPEVREAVIQTILHVARHFPIIRFDAAMTLARRHIQRLWYPEPGSGGGIPSRAEHGMSRAEFLAAMPIEFWREVVDRIAAEAPETLLLAEAFWLMEGYFVRTLGMHRVYNSAFMVMLRDEDNANYRSVIKNTLEFDPEVLKRYVNFMNNPDERTAIDQFGNGDKYFGVCTLLVTLPGLPMFGHGQVEGFTEKYGMEYRRATRLEEPDRGLIERHEREIFPLLHRRHLFAEAGEFRLYDLYAESGHVNEDVFAYSNRSGDERALVVYNNRYAQASGWIRDSAAYAVKRGPDTKTLERAQLAHALGLSNDPSLYCVFRDLRSGQEFVRAARELNDRGLHVQLGAYGCRVYLDFREVRDSEREPWAQVARELGGGGTTHAWNTMRAIRTRPIIQALGALLEPAVVEALFGPPRERAPAIAVGARRFADFGAAVAREAGSVVTDADSVEWFKRMTPLLVRTGARPPARRTAPAPASARPQIPPAPTLENEAADRVLLLAGASIAGVVRLLPAEELDPCWTRDWGIDSVIANTIRSLGIEAGRAERAGAILAIAASETSRFALAAGRGNDPLETISRWQGTDPIRAALGVNHHAGTWWFSKEACEELLSTMVRIASSDRAIGARDREATRRLAARLAQAAAQAGYRLEDWGAGLRGARSGTRRSEPPTVSHAPR